MDDGCRVLPTKWLMHAVWSEKVSGKYYSPTMLCFSLHMLFFFVGIPLSAPIPYSLSGLIFLFSVEMFPLLGILPNPISAG